MAYFVLLIEDEGLEGQSLYQFLLNTHQNTALAYTPEKADALLAESWPDVIIVNLLAGSLNLAAFEGVISQVGLNVPRLTLVNDTGMNDLPADALIYPPYTNEQLTQKIDQIVTPDRFLRVGPFTLDTQQKNLLHAGKRHKLTPKIYRLLHLLLTHEGQLVQRKTIMKQVWETDYMGDTRTLDVHAHWIREKIEADPSRPKHLLTVRGFGFRFKATVD